MHLATIGAAFALFFFVYKAYNAIAPGKGGEKVKSAATSGPSKTPPGPKRRCSVFRWGYMHKLIV